MLKHFIKYFEYFCKDRTFFQLLLYDNKTLSLFDFFKKIEIIYYNRIFRKILKILKKKMYPFFSINILFQYSLIFFFLYLLKEECHSSIERGEIRFARDFCLLSFRSVSMFHEEEQKTKRFSLLCPLPSCIIQVASTYKLFPSLSLSRYW